MKRATEKKMAKFSLIVTLLIGVALLLYPLSQPGYFEMMVQKGEAAVYKEYAMQYTIGIVMAICSLMALEEIRSRDN